MAVTAKPYNELLRTLADASDRDLISQLYVLAVNGDYTFDATHDVVFGIYPHEIDATGTNPGDYHSLYLDNVTVAEPADGMVTVNSDPVSWATFTGDLRGFVIFSSANNDPKPYGYIDLGVTTTYTAELVSLSFTNGLFVLGS